MAGGIVYLVNFPDGTQTAHNVMSHELVEDGSEILPGWVVTKKSALPDDRYLDGLKVSIEVWVEPKAEAEPDLLIHDA